MDIKFEQEDYKFNVRVSCVIKDKKHCKVLLSKMRGVTGAYLLPGGRVEKLESTINAIRRELNEELGLSTQLEYKLISIEEDFNKNINFHMLEFVFYIELDDFAFFKNVDQGWDKFEIFDINDITSIDIRPKTVIELIQREAYDKIPHHINYDWGDSNKEK